MVERDNYSQKDWESVVGSRFDIFFRKWDDLSVHLSWRYKSEKEDVKRDRTRRIGERLKLRANQTHKPKSYITTFNRLRNEMKIPSPAIINDKSIAGVCAACSCSSYLFAP